MNLGKCKYLVFSLMIGGVLCLGLFGLLGEMRAAPVDLFVVPGGSGDCYQGDPCDLLTAVGQAMDGDMLYVGQGVYTGNGTAVVTVTNSIIFYGGWDGTTTTPVVRDPETYPVILDGEDARRVMYISGNITPTVDGFIIANGNATGLGGRVVNGYVFDSGGGIYSLDASPILVNNIITNNLASDLNLACGGGLYLQNGDSAILRDNEVVSNTATLSAMDGNGGGVYLSDSDAIVSDNAIRNNIAAPEGSAWGGGLYIEDSDATISGNRIVGNVASRTDFGSGGGFYAEHSDAKIVNNLVADNVSSVDGWGQGGGLFLSRSAATVSENTLQGNMGSVTGTGYGGAIRLGFSAALIDGNRVVSNTASSNNGAGGGFYIWASRSFTLSNNFIAGNRSDGRGGGVSVRAYVAAFPSAGLLANNTIVENTLGDAGEGIWAGSYSAITLTNNSIVSHMVGITNAVPASATVVADHTLFYGNALNYGSDVGSSNELTGSDPLFVDPAGWDYHLQPGSPAIDAGVAIPWMITDIDGDVRPQQGGYDIGADEFVLRWDVYLPLALRD